MSKSKPVFELTHPNAAGIDIGASSHFVAVPPDRDGQPVREFPSFTVDLERLAGWLAECGVDTVAKESTGVYWIPPVRASRVAGLHGLPGQRPACEERLRAQVRRAGLPMAAAVDELRPAVGRVPPEGRLLLPALRGKA